MAQWSLGLLLEGPLDSANRSVRRDVAKGCGSSISCPAIALCPCSGFYHHAHIPRLDELALPGGTLPLTRARAGLLGMSLDRAAEILTWPLAELDPLRLSLRMQVSHIVFMIGMKAWLSGTLGREADRERDPELEKLSLALRARLRDGAAPET
jgi:hypothetical protein